MPQYLASLRTHGKKRGLSFDNAAKNLVYVPQQFLPMDNPRDHLAQLWRQEPDQVHLITDESVGGVSRGAKQLQRNNQLDTNSIVVSTVGFEKINDPLSLHFLLAVVLGDPSAKAIAPGMRSM